MRDSSIGIVGTGLMGSGIAEASAVAGIQTVLVKATPGPVEPARDAIFKRLDKQVQKGKLSPELRDAAMGRLAVTGDRAMLGNADLVIEGIVEDLASKRRLFAELSPLLHDEAILASNTSTLRIAELAGGGPRPQRTIGLHFFSPVPAMQLVELAHLEGTEPAAIELAQRFVARLGKTAVPVLDSTGFVVNRLLVPYLVGAIAAFEQGLARPEDIDTAMRLGCNHPMGPLALADLIGLDVVYAMAKLLYADFGEARYQPPSLLRRLVQAGALGKKTGLGFYDYKAEGGPRGNPALTVVRSQDATHAA
jgi:3-hydroxybutyryl-CoA dehydrogenase